MLDITTPRTLITKPEETNTLSKTSYSCDSHIKEVDILMVIDKDRNVI
jgi:hypothetical protein